MKDNLRWLIFGAGAIGTYIGGSLALHGHQVVFLEQPAVAEALSQRGLHLNLQGEEHHLPAPRVCGSLGEALAQRPFQAAVFALKSFDTQPALRSIAPYAADLPPFLCLQNGVENEPALAELLGAHNVLPGTVTSAISRRAAGDILLERLRGIGLADGHPLSHTLAAALNEAGLNARLFPSAADMKWSKMLTNLVTNATCAILDMTPAEILADPQLFRLEARQLRETLAVMQAQGTHVTNLPGTPVRVLAFVIRYLPLSLARPLLKKAAGSGRGGKMPSFHIDLHSGRGQSEVDYLNGAVVRFGSKHNIATPVNQLLTTLLGGLTSGDIPAGQYTRQPARLLQELAR